MWTLLQTLETLNAIDAISKNKPVLIFKHSTRCSISDTAKNRLERSATTLSDANIAVYYLDLLQYRDISNAISSKYQITHESPQVLLIKNGAVVLHQSHMQIQPSLIAQQAMLENA